MRASGLGLVLWLNNYIAYVVAALRYNPGDHERFSRYKACDTLTVLPIAADW